MSFALHTVEAQTEPSQIVLIHSVINASAYRGQLIYILS